jgi:hypothetical protein
MSEQTEATQIDPGSQVEAAEAAPALFIDTLPEDLRDNATLKRFTNVGDLAKSYVNARQHIGDNKITLPGKHTTESEWNEIYSKLGRPDTAGEYDFSNVQGYSQSGLDFFNDVAHANGLSPKQAENIAKSLIEQGKSKSGEIQANGERLTQEGLETLKEKYGQAYEQKVNLAEQAAQRLDAVKLLQETILQDGRKLGNVPEVVQFFVKLGEDMQEDNLIGQPNEPIMTPDDAEKEYFELMGSDAHVNKKHPKHQFVVNRVMELRDLMTPEIEG